MRPRTDVRVPFADLRSLHDELREEIDDAIREVIDSSAFILGPDVAAFEEEFAGYCEVDHCIGVASGTAALELAYQALGIGPGDEIIAPANTFVATVLPLLELGARPVLVDCDPDTALIDVSAAEEAVTSSTKAIVPVHLYGQPADLAPVLDLAERAGVDVVEDAAQAHGARYRGRRVGAIGRVGCFSFYPAKNLGALGDGGAVVTNDSEVAERVRLLRHLGQERKYRYAVPGRNERLDTLQAAVLRVKLRHLDRWNEQRRQAADAYAEELAGLELSLPSVASGRDHVWHLYVVRTRERDRLRDALSDSGVQTGMHYPVPLHLQRALAPLGYSPGAFPAAEGWAQEGLSLPMFPGLDRERVQIVAERIAAGLSR